MYSLRILNASLGESTNVYLGNYYTVVLQKENGNIATRGDFDKVCVIDENGCENIITKDLTAYIVMKDGSTYECLNKS